PMAQSDYVKGNTGFVDAPTSLPLPNQQPSVLLNNVGGYLASLDRGVRFADLNGDGRLDMVIGRAEGNASGGFWTTQLVYLNTPAGWVDVSSKWQLPGTFVYFYWGNNNSENFSMDNGLRLLDVNGDGRADLVVAYSDPYGNVTQITWLNNGSGWTQQAA